MLHKAGREVVNIGVNPGHKGYGIEVLWGGKRGSNIIQIGVTLLMNGPKVCMDTPLSPSSLENDLSSIIVKLKYWDTPYLSGKCLYQFSKGAEYKGFHYI